MYRIVRSIVESSTRQEYMHNQPIRVNESTIKFVKYRGPKRLWTITIQKFLSEEEKGWMVYVEGVPVTLTIYEGSGRCTGFELNVGGRMFTDVYELEAIYVTADTPYAKPICLADLLQRLIVFVDTAR